MSEHVWQQLRNNRWRCSECYAVSNEPHQAWPCPGSNAEQECQHDKRFHDVFHATKGCIACEAEKQARIVTAIEAYCQRYAHPGVNAGTHAALNGVLAIISEANR